MRRNKNVFPTLLFVIAALMLLSLSGCKLRDNDSTLQEICAASCVQSGGEYKDSFDDQHGDHRCVCIFEIPHFVPAAKSVAKTGSQS